jgi:hypothetical protein
MSSRAEALQQLVAFFRTHDREASGARSSAPPALQAAKRPAA